MNIAFPAALIAAFLLPGLICRYAYARGSWGWNSSTSMRGIVDEFVLGFVLSMALHAMWLVVASHVRAPDLAAAIGFASSTLDPSKVEAQRIVGAFADNWGHVLAYFVTLYAVSAGLGNVAHRFVRRFRLDHTTQALRFSNSWYYVLSGEYASLDQDRPEPIAGVYLSTVVDHGGKSYLYRGIVADFTFDRDGQLSTIVLTEAHRRLLTDDGPRPDGMPRYYDIEGDFFVLKYADAKTINLDYFFIEEVSETVLSGQDGAREMGV